MFDSTELSRFLGRPVHLFIFRRQHLTWRFASSDRDIVVGEHTYTAAQISRSEIRQTIERAKDKLTIKVAYTRNPAALEVPSTQGLGDNWFPYTPSDSVTVVCMSMHYGDDGAPVVEWMGEVTQPRFRDTELELVCEPGNGLGRARGQGARWQRNCWKTVYSTGLRGCNLGAEARTVTGIVTKVEQISGDVPPQAHVLVPEFAGYVQSLAGRSLTWTTVGVDHSSSIAAAYFAYTVRTVMMPIHSESTVFKWDPIGDREDSISQSGPITIYRYYTPHPALVIADAGGLEVGSIVTCTIPPVGVVATLAEVDGDELTAPEFADSAFGLAGGFISFVRSGLQMRRDIATHVPGSTTLTLVPGGRNPHVGDSVTAMPTCPRTWQACASRGNTDNYGGSLFKPVKNPTEGVSMSWG